MPIISLLRSLIRPQQLSVNATSTATGRSAAQDAVLRPARAGTTAALAPARDLSLDGIRVAAMFLVVTIHASAKGFGNFGSHWWAVNLYESASRIAVPLFFMVSGVLLLPKAPTIASIRNRLWRILVPLLAWSVIYLLWLEHAGQPTPHWIPRMIQAPVMGHLWYLYTLIGVYLFLPVISGFYRANPLKVQLFCLVFWFYGASVVPLEVALTGSEHVGVNWSFLSLYAGYLVVGALLYHHLPARPGAMLLGGAWAIWAVSVAAVAYLTWRRCTTLLRADETFYVYSSPLVLIGAIAAFVVLRDLFNRRLPVLLSRLLTALSKVSFGVYLLHVLALFYFDTKGYDYRFINPWLAIPCLVLFTTASCALLVGLMQRIPLVRLIVPS